MTDSAAIRRDGAHVLLPGIATAHSHAFQRALRGRTERRATHAGTFWSWRGLMYELATKVDEDTLYALSRFAFVELAMSGVTCVGEFHYLHHQPDGVPYSDRTRLAEVVITAAKSAGLRVTLLRTLYERAGAGLAPEPGQRRFCDIDVDDALRDVDTLRARYAGDPLVRIGLAPHSTRAVTLRSFLAASDYARKHALPLHSHVAEQRRELDECVAEHGLPPLALLGKHGIVDGRFVAVHATHLDDDEAQLLGAARAFACICRTTERNLGDGIGRTARLVRAGVRLCTGTDSHSSSDPFEEARAIELDDRAAAEARHVVGDAPSLLDALTRHAYAAVGFAGHELEDQVRLRADDVSIAGATDAMLPDAIVFGATPRAVDEVRVGGRTIVASGRHVELDAARRDYLGALAKLGLT